MRSSETPFGSFNAERPDNCDPRLPVGNRHPARDCGADDARYVPERPGRSTRRGVCLGRFLRCRAPWFRGQAGRRNSEAARAKYELRRNVTLLILEPPRLSVPDERELLLDNAPPAGFVLDRVA